MVFAHGREVTPPNARSERLRDGLDFLQTDDFPKSGVNPTSACETAQIGHFPNRRAGKPSVFNSPSVSAQNSD
jgi:hypothetical protein